jgi:eukaryotic-like serine/threonine-protein kinase
MQYGRYQIVAELGRGSMGVVYKAHDPQIDRLIALKVLREDRVASEDFVRRFLKEAMAVGRLSHPGIVTVYDVGQDHGSIYIAMEFLQGTSLDVLMTETKLPLEKIVDIAMQIAQALHYAHQHGIVHRDIKPPNIICSPQGVIRVTDFGIARIEDPNGHQMTQAGEILGTPLYMSPEQVMGHPLDGRSDLFSLGVILYQLTTGKRPFAGTTLPAIFRAITQDAPEPPKVIEPTIPKPLSDLIMRLLEKDSVLRFAGGDDLIIALKSCLQPQTTSPKAARQGHINNKQTGIGIRKIMIVGLVLIVACCVTAGYLFFIQSPEPGRDNAQQQRLPAPPVATQRSESPGGPVNQELQGQRSEMPDGSSQGKESIDRQVGKKTDQPQALPGDGKKKNIPSLSPTRAKEGASEKIEGGQQALLKVDSRPQGAELYIDGSRAGTTPVNLTATAMKHEVKLKLAKHLGWEAQLDLSKGGEVPLFIQLLPETAPNP